MKPFSQTRSRHGRKVFNACFAVISLGLCLVAIYLEWRDQSFGAFSIAIM